jgi:hypothetical protein
MARLRFLIAVGFIHAQILISGTFANDPETDVFSRPVVTDPFRSKFLVFEKTGETTVHEDVRLHLLGGDAFLVLRPTQYSRSGQSTPVYQQWLRLSSHARFTLFETRIEAERFVKPTLEEIRTLNDDFSERSSKTFPHPEQISDPLHSKGIIMETEKFPIIHPRFDLHAVGSEYFLSLKSREQVGQSSWLPFLSVDRIITFNSDEDAMAFARLMYPGLNESPDRLAVPAQK